jgi:hypothetical protein
MTTNNAPQRRECPGLTQQPAAPADAEILALGQELEAAWETQRRAFEVELSDDDADTAIAPCRRIVERIINAPACTLDGLGVKARAFLWCGYDRVSLTDLGATTDCQLASSILRDLVAGKDVAHG